MPVFFNISEELSDVFMVHKKQWFKIHIGSLFIMLICHFSEHPKQVELRNFRACIFAWYMYWYIDLDQEIITLFQFILVCSHRSWICICTCFARDWTKSFAMLRGFFFLIWRLTCNSLLMLQHEENVRVMWRNLIATCIWSPACLDK